MIWNDPPTPQTKHWYNEVVEVKKNKKNIYLLTIFVPWCFVIFLMMLIIASNNQHEKIIIIGSLNQSKWFKQYNVCMCLDMKTSESKNNIPNNKLTM